MAERRRRFDGDFRDGAVRIVPDEHGWTMAQFAEWPAVVTCGGTIDEARDMLVDAAREMFASYRDEGREPPIGGGRRAPRPPRRQLS